MAAARVLLVEDDHDLRMALVVRLKATGFDCDAVSNGKEGLERIARRRPDVVIVDLLMPVMDGYDMVHHLRANPKTSTIPIVVVTALSERSRGPRATELEGLRVIQKPFEAKELIDAVRALLADHA